MRGLANERPDASAGADTPDLSSASVRLLVVEDGASVLEGQAPSDRGDQTVVVFQSGGERPMEFAARTIRRISTLEQQQRRIVRGVLLLSPRFDAEATAARLCLARVLRAHSVAMASAPLELLVSAGADLDTDLQTKVLSLVALAERGNASLSITVQFASDGAPLAHFLSAGPVGSRRSVCTGASGDDELGLLGRVTR
jgi:hypothetical protein